MGYTTSFAGQITVDPPLNSDEIAFLTKFNETRRMSCQQGPYYVDRGGFYGQDHGPDVINYNEPPAGQPGLWCKWIPTEDGTAIEWDGAEKFTDAENWMQYIIDHFIGSDPLAKPSLRFLTGHVCNGVLDAQGEDPSDHWLLVVENNTARKTQCLSPPSDGDNSIIDGEYEVVADNQRLLQ